MIHKAKFSIMQSVVCCICVFIITACDNAPGPPKFEDSGAKSIKEDVRTQRTSLSARESESLLAKSDSESNRIQIDSVPRGAEVSYLPGGPDSKASSIPVGKTPLELDSNKYPSGTFVIMMNMDTYLQAINGIPGLKEWIEQFNSQNDFYGCGYGGSSELFQFDTSTTQQVIGANQKLVAVGPVYTLDEATSDRINALFVPQGVSVREFFPLMPTDGTYFIDKDSYGSSLVVDYGFNLSQASEAVQSLSRCGKYVTTVDEFKPTGRRSMVVLSAQRGSFLTSAYALR